MNNNLFKYIFIILFLNINFLKCQFICLKYKIFLNENFYTYIKNFE